MKYCTKCGKEYDDSMNFCTNCGAQLMIKDSGEQQTPPTPVKKEKTHKNGILYKILIAVVIAGVVAFLVYNRNETNKRRIEQNKIQSLTKYVEIGKFGAHGAEGLALVSQKIEGVTLYGMINEKYEEVIPCVYMIIDKFKNSRSIAFLVDKFLIIDTKGNIVKFLQGSELFETLKNNEWSVDKHESNSCYIVGRTGKWGLFDYSGKVIIPLMYDFVGNAGTGLVDVRSGGKHGLFSVNGKQLTDIKYDKWINIYDSYRCGSVFYNGKEGLLDRYGNEVVPAIYDELDLACYDIRVDYPCIKTELNGKYGLIDKNTWKKIADPIYDDVVYYEAYFHGERYAVQKYDKWGFIDPSGKLIIDFKYDDGFDHMLGGGDKLEVRLHGTYTTFWIDKMGYRVSSPY